MDIKKEDATVTNTTHTPGPWGWFGTPYGGFYLATVHSGRRYVMGFRRMGMHLAQPEFQPGNRGMVPAKDLCIFEVCPEAESADDPRVYRRDIIGFRSADARLIASAPDLLEALKEAEAMFRWYGDLHQQKDPPDTEKAIRNYDMAEKLDAVIAKAEGRTNG